MKCPYCGSVCANDAQYCPNCKQPLIAGVPSGLESGAAPQRRPWLQKLGIAILTVGFIAALCVGVSKLLTWMEEYEITRLYTRGAYRPTLTAVQMDDLRQGHAVTFYGHDGDQIFLPEMNRSLTISGGIARLEIADSDWFGLNVSDIDYADITLSPLLVTEKGSRTKLPPVNFKIDVPESPLVISSPASPRITVVTGTYPLTLNVVPGSTVFVNGENVTPDVDRSGLLSTHVAVQPIGDNVITLIVRTPRHREHRDEVVIYREHYDINLELDTTVSDRSSSKTMAITGTTEPGAMIEVETDYIAESLSIDMSTGRFSFIARFTRLGDNTVRFKATMPGRQDATISFNVYYLPTLADYSAGAWRMDYSGLVSMSEQWHGRVFACRGTIMDIVYEDGISYVIMDVGDDTRELVVLENQTSVQSPTLGRRYLAYADVSGLHWYQNQYYPMLIARYMDLSDT